MLFKLQYWYLRAKEKAKNIGEYWWMMTHWHITSAYWALWQAYDNAFHPRNPTVSLKDSTTNLSKDVNPTPRPDVYSVILTSAGEQMIKDITEINNQVNGLKYSKQQWIAAVINTYLVKEHKAALEIRANLASVGRKQGDHLKLVKK